MLTILINAYACSPNMGSEPGMAWNWCINLAKYCELHIITEGEFRDKIEAVLPTLPQGKNMHFYYTPVSEEVRKKCWNQGDWRFYFYYKKWQWKTYILAKEIIKMHKIDIVHQLNMIGFREPGYLWKIENLPFVWGPIGGLKQFPTAYLKGASIKQVIFNYIKNAINIIQLYFDSRIGKAFKKADLLISSIPDSYNAIRKYKGLDSVIIPETGCFVKNNNLSIPRDLSDKYDDLNEKFQILWVGKFDFRKQLPIAIKAISMANNRNIHLNIYGSGNNNQKEKIKRLIKELGIGDQITFYGKRSNNEVMDAMRKSHVFMFTSLSEDTSTVVLEAISNLLPVVCFNTCGMGYVIDESVGVKINLTNTKKSINDFANVINDLEADRNKLRILSKNCISKRIELSWENKASQMVRLYKKIIYNNGKGEKYSN
ncbi:MAG: glycosyl transferase family 1 [Prevotella sp. AG:487_50_53]|nr:MAG: glycosyl transferase family 1 [Prevotella sp. AG:487_50_53]